LLSGGKLKKLSIFVAGFFLLIIYTSEVYANTKGSFLSMGTGARALGMGSAFCAVADDADAVYWNPAGLAFLSKPEITGLHINLWEDTLYDSLNYAHPINGIGTFGVGVIRLSTDEIEKRESPLDAATTFSDTQTAFFLTYGKNIYKTVFGGINLKAINQKIDNYSDSGWGMDIGLLWNVNANFSTGINLQNALAPTLKLKIVEEKYPLNAKVGVAYHLFNVLPRHNNKITLAIDVDKTEGFTTKQHYGLEYWIENRFALRGGYREDNLTGGLGVRYRNFQCDYAFAPHELGETHRFSFTARFGFSLEEKGRKVQQKEQKKKRIKAKKYYKEGEEKAKAGSYQEAVDIWKKEAFPWARMGGDEKLESKIKKSIEGAEKEINKEKQARFFSKGMRFIQEGECLKAYRKFKQVLKINPLYKDAILQVAEAKKRIFEAVSPGGKARLHFEEGLNSYATGRYNTTIKEWKKALALEPELKELNNYIEKVKQERERLIPTPVRLGDRHYQNKEYLQAIKEWEQALAFNPESEAIKKRIIQARKKIRYLTQRQLARGKKELKAKNMNKALEKFLSVLKMEPENQEAKKYISLIRKKLKKTKKQKQDISKSVTASQQEKPQKTDVLLKQAEDYYFQYRYEKAIEILEQILKVEPTNKQAQSFLERVRKVKGK
jgi:tetratricopeptide (TPR) repeat protein